MSQMPDPFPRLSALLRETIGDLLADDATTLLDMAADDIVFEFPYSPPGGVSRLEGKAALAEYLPDVASMITIAKLELTGVYRCVEPGVAVLEFAANGHGNATGVPYCQRYISVIRVADGRIVQYRDYWNPLTAIAAVGGNDALGAALRGTSDEA